MSVAGIVVTATPAAIDLVLASGGHLFVWSVRSSGCQPLTWLRTSFVPVAGRTFRRIGFEGIELHLAESRRWPQELGFDVRRGRLRALWDGAAWAV